MLKKLFSEAVLYGVSTVLIRLINYTLIPIHTKVFAPAEFGIVSIFYAYAVLFNALYSYGMETTFFRFMSKADESEKPQVYNRILTSLISSSLLFSAIMYGFSAEIASFLGYANAQHYVQWFAILFAIDAILIIPFAKLRAEHKAKQFVSLKLAEVIVTVGLNLFFLVICPKIYSGDSPETISWFYNPNLGIGYAFLSNLYAKAFVLLLLWKAFANWRPAWDWTHMKQYYKYGFPFILTGVAVFVNESSDKLMLEAWLPEGFYSFGDSTYAVGVYSACYKLSIFITLAVTAFKYAAEPFFFAQADDKNSPETFSRVMRYFIIVLMIMVVGVCTNIDWLSSIFIRRDSYKVGLSIVPFLLMANMFLGIYYSLSVWFKVTDRTKFGAFISLGGALVTLLGNYLLIPVLGYHGSAIATLICYALMAITSYVLGQRYYPIPYKLGNALLHMIGGLLFILFAYYLHKGDFWGNFFLQNCIFAGYLIFVGLIERKEIKKMLQRH
ncbi:oligosaccharide flippase family protein [Limibacter armeniacum]|uniref:oligosaccharide flippase family protein n=1 Tax=Limibacter armeniacum TaxID=466084 RepID=UPI002FE52258